MYLRRINPRKVLKRIHVDTISEDGLSVLRVGMSGESSSPSLGGTNIFSFSSFTSCDSRLFASVVLYLYIERGRGRG